LDGFSKTHVIGQDAVHFLEGEFDHPDEGFLLVFLEFASFEGFGLGFAKGILEFFQGFGVVDFPVEASIDLGEKLIELSFLEFEIDWSFGLNGSSPHDKNEVI
jgi:hypothetical protein